MAYCCLYVLEQVNIMIVNFIVMHLIFFLLADELKSHINSIYIAYYFTSVIVFLLINRAGSFKIVNLNVIVCIFVNVLSLLVIYSLI